MTSGFHRLHALRMANDAKGYEMDEMRPRFARIADRHANGTAPMAVSSYQLFQTPPAIAAQLAALLDLPAGARVLEPSAGLGRLLDAVQPYAPREVVAVEQAPQCAGQLFRQDREGVTIRQRDFLEVEPEEFGSFDAVLMNPPFHLRADIRHIDHARRFLRPGGRLAAVCMLTPHRRDHFQPHAEKWIELPPGTFRAEGTGVACALLVLSA